MTRALLGAIFIDILLAGYGFIAYPAGGTGKPEDFLLEFLLVVVIFLYLFAAIFGTREYDAVDRWVHRLSMLFGLAAGILLVGVVVNGSLGDTPLFGSLGSTDSGLFQGIGLTLVAGALLSTFAGSIYAARRTGQVSAGVQVGLWSGLIASLIAFAAFSLISYGLMGQLIQSPSNIADFVASGEPEISAYLVKTARVAGTMVLALGLPIGASLGALGGLVGRQLARIWR